METIQLDTNIVLRSAEPSHPSHQHVVKVVKKYLDNGDELCLIPQNLIEFWNVATRPIDKNGFGWTSSKAYSAISSLESMFSVLSDSKWIFEEWKNLVLEHNVMGKQVHDARIVAAMNVHSINYLLSFNVSDFKRYSHITVIDPDEIDFI